MLHTTILFPSSYTFKFAFSEKTRNKKYFLLLGLIPFSRDDDNEYKKRPAKTVTNLKVDTAWLSLKAWYSKFCFLFHSVPHLSNQITPHPTQLFTESKIYSEESRFTQWKCRHRGKVIFYYLMVHPENAIIYFTASITKTVAEEKQTGRINNMFYKRSSPNKYKKFLLSHSGK